MYDRGSGISKYRFEANTKFANAGGVIFFLAVMTDVGYSINIRNVERAFGAVVFEINAVFRDRFKFCVNSKN